MRGLLMVFDWTEDLSLDIDVIDLQHKAIVQQLNRLADALENDRNKDELRNLVNSLEDSIFKHFAEEERLMKQFNYPGFLEHREIHADFVRELASLRSQILIADITPALLQFFAGGVESWISEHILGLDKAMAEFIKAKEVFDTALNEV